MRDYFMALKEKDKIEREGETPTAMGDVPSVS